MATYNCLVAGSIPGLSEISWLTTNCAELAGCRRARAATETAHLTLGGRLQNPVSRKPTFERLEAGGLPIWLKSLRQKFPSRAHDCREEDVTRFARDPSPKRRSGISNFGRLELPVVCRVQPSKECWNGLR